MDGTTLLGQLFNGAAAQPAFGRESRYHGLPIASLTTPGGEELRFVTRRLIPSPDTFPVLAHRQIALGDRVDAIAAATLGDPLSYWRLCDANLAFDPDEITAVPGRFVRIPLPGGMPGA